MYDWFYILSNQWYITLSTHDSIYEIAVNKKNYKKCMMWYFIIGITFSLSTSSWINMAHVLKKKQIFPPGYDPLTKVSG